MKRMKRLTIELPGEMAAFVSDLLLGLRAGAVSEEQREHRKPLIHAYFKEETDIAGIITTVREFSAIFDENPEAVRFTTRYIDQADWEGWKSYLKPVKASRRIVIKPPWEKQYKAERGTKVVEINPGNAFGTGHHETTRICISYLDEIIEKFPRCSVFDVGCGSGILGICSIKLGACISFCADIDFKAAKETISNSARNATSDKVKVWCGSADCTRKKFDVVVSNTSKDTLISMKESLKERLLPLGHLIVSGIQANEKREVAEIYGNSGYDIVSGKVEGGWAGLLLRLKKTRKPAE
jgi:ribosomal protein L11 methyltransferase